MKREEAIKCIRDFMGQLTEGCQEALKSAFPELAESEDERIRKEIISALKFANDGGVYDKHIAYLEKQKESLHISETCKENANSFTDGIIEVRSFQRGVEEGRRLEKQKEPHYTKRNALFDKCVENCDPEVMKEVSDKVDEMLEKEQKPALIAENDNWYICIKDFYAGGKKWASVGDLVQAKNGMYMMGRDDISEWFRRAYFEEVRDAFGPNTDTDIPEQKPAESISQLTVQGKGVYKICPRCKERMVRDDSMVYTSMPPQYRYECPKCGESECDTVMYDNPKMEEQKPAEWSEEDEERLELVIDCVYEYYPDPVMKYKLKDWLKSLRPSWKPSDEQMKVLQWRSELPSCPPGLKSLYEDLKKLI